MSAGVGTLSASSSCRVATPSRGPTPANESAATAIPYPGGRPSVIDGSSASTRPHVRHPVLTSRTTCQFSRGAVGGVGKGAADIKYARRPVPRVLRLIGRDGDNVCAEVVADSAFENLELASLHDDGG